MKWVGIFQVGIFWVGIFRGGIFLETKSSYTTLRSKASMCDKVPLTGLPVLWERP